MSNTTILATTTEAANNTVDEIDHFAELLNNYGVAIVTIAVFLAIVVAMFALFFKMIYSGQKNQAKQNELIINKLLATEKEVKKCNDKKEKDLMKIFVKVDDSTKDVIKKISDETKPDRLSIYAIHNGVQTSHGLPFIKTTCVSEHIRKNCGIIRKGMDHVGIPLQFLDDSIKDVYRQGSLVIHNIEDYKSTYPVIYNMCKDTGIISGVGVAVYDQDNNVLGILVAEFVKLQAAVDLEILKDKLIEETTRLAPILEYSDYQSYSAKVDSLEDEEENE